MGVLGLSLYGSWSGFPYKLDQLTTSYIYKSQNKLFPDFFKKKVRKLVNIVAALLGFVLEFVGFVLESPKKAEEQLCITQSKCVIQR